MKSNKKKIILPVSMATFMILMLLYIGNNNIKKLDLQIDKDIMKKKEFYKKDSILPDRIMNIPDSVNRVYLAQQKVR